MRVLSRQEVETLANDAEGIQCAAVHQLVCAIRLMARQAYREA